MPVKNIILNAHSQIIIRTPHFTLDDVLSENMDKLKLLIKEASPDFYNVIEDFDMLAENNSFNKIHFAIWKYFNRAKFRATPFGRFAAVAISTKNSMSSKGSVILKDELQEHIFRDWNEWQEIIPNGKALISKAKYFVTNSTVYLVGDEIRFTVQSHGKFEISTADQFEELIFLCEYCRFPRQKSDIQSELLRRFDLDDHSIRNLLFQLTENQILFTDHTPNIIGKDFFARQTENAIDFNRKVYRMTQRDCISGYPANHALNEVPELITFLNANLPDTVNPDLRDFRLAFVKKFDRQTVPLTIALDPELGIGYAALETGINVHSNQTFKNVFNSVKSNGAIELKLNPLLIFILSKSSLQRIVLLEEFTCDEQRNESKIPNSFSMLYHRWEGKTVIHHVGGCTANALIGRFTHCGSDFEYFGSEIADSEQKANPDAIFFDVSYRAESHVDNVNRRKKLYKYELPMFNWCDSKEMLTLDDIEICVLGEEIILKSRRLRKRIIPRIPTAYNYTRSDFSVYRFLSDLQHHLIRSDLNLPIRKYIPGQSHYPRLVYKNMILSPEMWLIDKKFIQILMRCDLDGGIVQLSTWLLNNQVSALFLTGTGDQILTFNSNTKEDLVAFCFYCRQNHKSDIYLSEAFISEDTGISNEFGRQYHGQFLASFYHQSEIYKMDRSYSVSSDFISVKRLRRLTPGTEWLYFEIYCNPIYGNVILLTKIKYLIKEVRTMIKNWFFVRFKENGHHLRLRVELKSKSFISAVITKLNTLLSDNLACGTVSDIQIKTYQREIERYGKWGFPQIETFFKADSEFVLRAIGKLDQSKLYQCTLELMYTLIAITFDKFDSQMRFTMAISATFSEEFNFNSASFKAININYEQFRKEQKIVITSDTNIAKLGKEYKKLLGNSTVEKDRHSLLADVLHLHINRKFSDDNRKHEAILYQYLLKDMKRMQKDSFLTKVFSRTP
jgi:thiopeptide-type bacteriocin biosynthesis protein